MMGLEGVILHFFLKKCPFFWLTVEQRKNPELRGLPTAVVQYNNWKGGGLIAVSYEARKFGVKRLVSFLIIVSTVKNHQILLLLTELT